MVDTYFRYNKLKEVYKEYSTIIVGVDFDDTLFALNDVYKDTSKAIRQLLLEAKPIITLCLYTVADDQSLKYKIALMEEWGIAPDYVNESPVKLGNGDKPFFNILLDDKAGLIESFELLREFNEKL